LWLVVVAVLQTAACFNIVVDEGQSRSESLTVMPVLGDIDLLPGHQASNRESGSFDAPVRVPLAGADLPTDIPGAKFTGALEPLPKYRLTVNGVPATGPTLTLDGGTVEVSLPPEEPDGLYGEGDLVQLTAVPEEGYRFNAWAGGCVRNGQVCTIAFDGNKDLSAEFVPLIESYAFDLVAYPDGGGEVQVQPAPNAPGGGYVDGTLLELEAVESEGFEFTGWDGACAGGEKKCRIVMNTDQSVSARFAHDYYTLTIDRVLVDLAGVSLSQGQMKVFPFAAPPADGFDHSARVLLDADPDPGLVVIEWGGDCSGLDPDVPQCTLVMDGDRFVEITFAEGPAGNVP
jgi:hypothetical protein